MPKCISGLKRSLFPCKYNPQVNQENYVMFNYDSPNNTNSSSLQQPPATSTMIDSSFFKTTNNNTYVRSFKKKTTNKNHHGENLAFQRTVSCIEGTTTSDNSDMSTFVNGSPTTYYYQLLQTADDEMEISRKTATSPFESHNADQITANDDYDDLTIVKHNNSPMSSNYTATSNYFQLDEFSMIGNNDYCLQSTKLSSVCEDEMHMQGGGGSSTCVQCHRVTSPPPPHPTPQQHSTMLSHSPDDPSSTTFATLSSNFESIIHGLSMLIENEDQHSEQIDSMENHVNSRTYVCSTDYEATFVDDLSVHFADTVKILKDNHDDWLYVQVSTDGRRGYVPKTIVLDLKQFMHQLKENHLNISLDCR